MATSQAMNSTRADPVRHIAIQLAPSMRPALQTSPPIKTGMKVSGSDSARSDEFPIDKADIPGNQSVFVLVRDGDKGEETPVFPIENASADAILVFTHRDAAVLYLQVAEWTSYRLRELSPLEMAQWVSALERDHVAFLIVNANRLHQALGDSAQQAIDLRALRDLSGENLYQEIMTAG